jgi:hypothetical protein
MWLHLVPPRGFTVPLIVLAALLLPSTAHAAGDVNFSYGWRSLDDDTWDPVDEQDVFGVTVDFGGPEWPVNLAVGYYESEDEGALASVPVFGDVDVEGEVSEWSLGAHKVWRLQGPPRPFLGGGLTRVTGEARLESVLGSAEEDDDSTGVYIEGGVFFRFAEVVNVGFHARVVEGTDVTLFGVDGDADYYQLGVLFGFGWPQSK